MLYLVQDQAENPDDLIEGGKNFITPDIHRDRHPTIAYFGDENLGLT
jgi:hypothetical protein